MALRGVRDLADAVATTGQTWTAWMHKTSAPIPGAAGQWADLSMGAGTPKFNAYVGVQGEATALVNTNNSAFYLPAVGATANSSIHAVLVEAGMQTTQGTQSVPLSYVLADYLLFYPLLDGDDLDVQTFTQTASLPRYTTGEGVHAFLVCTSPMTTNGALTINYTNSSGVSGRTVSCGVAASSTLGPIVNRESATIGANTATPFIPLAGGDDGIRSVESVQFTASTGGFMALVLCKPLTQLTSREANTMTERTMLMHGATTPRIYDGAFIQPLFCTSGTGSPAVVRGFLTMAWR